MALTVEKAFHRCYSLCWIRHVSVEPAPFPPPPSWPAVLALLLRTVLQHGSCYRSNGRRRAPAT